MHKLLVSLMVIFLSIGIANAAEDDIPAEVQTKLTNALQNSNAIGKYYVISFPPNDQGAAPQSLDIFVAASERTVVKLINSNTGDVKQRIIEATGTNANNFITTFSSAGAEPALTTASELLEHERGIFKSFILESNKPISVYVLNSRRFSTDGYLAIPVTAWGNDYILCSYYEWVESTQRNWYSGGVIMAAEDGTIVNIKIKGTPGTRTWGGRSIDDEITIRLDKGEVYMLTTDGTTKRTFDLSGTEIVADKPIGLVTFVQRTVMPQPLSTSRDHMVAMVPPVQAWGTEYSSIELDREGAGGDMYRFMASEDNTAIEVFWFDKQTGDPLGFRSYFLNKGQFEEYYGNADPGVQSIRGTVFIKADKPIFVMQYCYSQGWDPSTSQFDPFMFPVISVNQFTQKTIFQTPSNKSGDNEYLTNKFNLIAIGDPDDVTNHVNLMNSITLDGNQVTTLKPDIIGNRIPNTNLYWINLEVDIGPHFIEAGTPFGGYIYGFARYDTYAWPAATAYNNLRTVDTLPPLIELKEEECGLYKLIATELRNGADDDDPQQIDEGIIDFPFVTENINFKEPLELDPEFEDMEWAGYPQDYEFNYIAEVEDKYADAYLEYNIPDATGLNIAYDTLVYEADSLIVVSPIFFGLNRVGVETDEKIIEVTSASDNTITIEDIQIKGTAGGVYRIVQGIEAGFELLPRETTTFSMVYTPEVEYLDLTENPGFGKYDVDTLMIETSCLLWEWPILGQGGKPYMTVSDWIDNQATEEQLLSMENDTRKKITITNYNYTLGRQATWPLIISGLDLANITDQNGANVALGEFTPKGRLEIDANGDFINGNIDIPASTDQNVYSVDVTDVEFYSAASGQFVRNIPLKSNANNDVVIDGISIWAVDVAAPGPAVSNVTWAVQRVGLPIQGGQNSPQGEDTGLDGDGNATGDIIVRNLGTERVILTGVAFDNADAGNQYLSDDRNFRIKDELFGTTVGAVTYPTIDVNAVTIDIWNPDAPDTEALTLRIPVEFNPQGDYNASNNVVPTSRVRFFFTNELGDELTFDDGNGNTVNYLLSDLNGLAGQPVIAPTDYTFTEPTLVLNTNPNTGKVEVTNNSPNFPLTIWSIDETPDNQAGDFDFADENKLPQNDPAGFWRIGPGETKSFDVLFTPQDANPKNRTVKYIYTNDAVSGENGDPITVVAARDLTADSDVFGESKITATEVTSHDFGNVISCNTPVATLTLTNGSSDDNWTLTNFIPDGGTDWTDWATMYPEFEFNPTLDQIFNPSIDVQTTASIDVTYIPANATGPSDVAFTWEGTIDGNIANETGSLRGNPISQEITLSLPTVDNLDLGNVNNQFFRDPSTNNPVFPVSMNMTDSEGNGKGDNWATADVTELTMTIAYHESWLASDQNIITPGNMLNGTDWIVNAIEVEDPDDPTWRNLNITASGSTPLDADGIFAYPHFLILYGEGESYSQAEGVQFSAEPIIKNVVFGSRNDCVANIPLPGSVTIESCVANIRLLDLTGLNGEIDVNFNDQTFMVDVRFNSLDNFQSRIEIYDMSGNLVAVPMDQATQEGTYEASFNVSTLATGAYIVKTSIGFNQQTHKIMIVK